MQAWNALLLATVLALPVAAQVPGSMGVLQLDTPHAALQLAVGGEAALSLNWSYQPPNAAASATTGATSRLRFDPAPACASPEVTVTGPTSYEIPVDAKGASQSVYTGSAAFTVHAAPDAPGVKEILCTFVAYVEGPAGSTPPVTVYQAVHVAYDGKLVMTLLDRELTAGPQKAIPFRLTLENHGNAQTQVEFSATEAEGKWHIILPDIVILDAAGGRDANLTVTLTVLTPYSNGYVNKDTTFRITATPHAVDDTTRTGPAVSQEVSAHAKGGTSLPQASSSW